MSQTGKKSIIGAYDTHLQAIEALKILKKHHFPLEHVALVGNGGAVKEIDGVHTWEEVLVKGTEVGGAVGGIVGVLTGLTLVLVPGLGLIYGGGVLAAALLGGLEGTAFGALGGGLLGTVLGARYGSEGEATGKEDPEDLKKFKKMLQDGKFLLIVHGPQDEVKKAHQILIDEAKFSVAQREFLNN